MNAAIGRRVRLTDAEARAVNAGRFIRVDLGGFVRMPLGARTRTAFVARVDGQVRAWANLCQHNPVPLDVADPPEPSAEGVRGAPMAIGDEGPVFMCNSHGALFRPKDGLCVLGPCYGQRLHAIAVEASGAEIVLLPRDAPPPAPPPA